MRNILTARRLMKLATPTQPTTKAGPVGSLTQQFADRMRDGMVDEMVGVIDEVKRWATWILRTAMVINYLHQVGFLITLARLNLDTWQGILHASTVVLAASLVPLMIDFMTVLCIKVLSARAMAKPAKWTALAFLLIPSGFSGLINGMAPTGHWLLTALFIVPVVFIVMAETLRALIRPDVRAMSEAETAAASQVPAAVSRKLDPQVAAERAAKARITRERTRLAGLRLPALRNEAAGRISDAAGMRKADLVEALAGLFELAEMSDGYVPADAPVSPAIA